MNLYDHAKKSIAQLSKYDLDSIGNGIHNAQSHGYPAHAAGFGTPGGGGADVELTSMERIMESAGKPDPTRTDQRRWHRAIIMIVQAEQILADLATYAAHAPTATMASSIADDHELGADGKTMWCAQCIAVGHRAPIHVGSTCRWCYDWQREHNAPPDPVILRAHHDGRKITATMTRTRRR